MSLTSSMYAKGFCGFYRNSEYIDTYTVYDKKYTHAVSSTKSKCVQYKHCPALAGSTEVS